MRGRIWHPPGTSVRQIRERLGPPQPGPPIRAINELSEEHLQRMRDGLKNQVEQLLPGCMTDVRFFDDFGKPNDIVARWFGPDEDMKRWRPENGGR